MRLVTTEAAPKMKASNPKVEKMIDEIISKLGVLQNVVESDFNNRQYVKFVKLATTNIKNLKGKHWS